MNALILAAGRGTRISRYLEGKPKCTVDIGGKPLIQYTIELLRSKGIQKIGIVLGYQQQIIRDVLKGQDVDFFYNPFFDVTNSIASCWFAREFFQDHQDMIIMNGDVFMDPSVLDDVIAEKMNPVLISDETRKEEADYKLKYTDCILEKYGKELTGSDITGEYVGIAKISGNYKPTFLAKLLEMINSQKHSVWWENVLYELSGQQKIYVKNIAGKFWAEVDYIEDYQRIKAYISQNM